MYPFIKRIIDIAVSFMGLGITAIFFIPIAVAIKLDSRGSIIFSQKRLTKGCRPFNFFKFRTMVLNAEIKQNLLNEINEATGPIFKVKNDPRVTRVGRLLRKYSLDELPQFWNVIKGDMSLVGPRPPLISEVDRYEDWQKDRLLVKTGITGLWQVNGRGRLSFYEMATLDLEYIRNASVWLDLKIILKTFPQVMFGTGAY
ncbi:MAG: sugar transferase [bacterium]